MLVSNSSAVNPIKIYLSGYGVKYTGINDKGNLLPHIITLRQNFPNPFNPNTTISYELPGTVKVDLAIFNIRGQFIKSLVRQIQQAGSYSTKWDGTNESGYYEPSGLYIYRLKTGNTIKSLKMILIR